MAQPNVIFITADGFRADGMGCAGDPDIQTPNIDALAAHGIRFSNAVSPYPDHPAGGHALFSGSVPTAFPPGGATPAMPPTDFVLIRALRDAGYFTAVIGAPDFSNDHDPTLFDECQATGCPQLEDAYHAWLEQAGKAAPALPASDSDEPDIRLFPLGETYHPTTWTGKSAVRYCQHAREPFFLWVSFPRPRPPFDPPAPWNRMYRMGDIQGGDIPAGAGVERERDARKLLAAYYGCISQVDRQIGRLLATLTARGRTQNLILFTSGTGMPASSTIRRDESSTLLPDTRIRVPLLVAGYASQRKGVVEPALVSLGDVAPTVFELLQLGQAPDVAGRSFHRQLVNAGVSHRLSAVSVGRDGASCLRTARYKWVSGPDDSGEYLFDLQADPLEMHNLEGAQQSLAIRKMLLGLSQRDSQQS